MMKKNGGNPAMMALLLTAVLVCTLILLFAVALLTRPDAPAPRPEPFAPPGFVSPTAPPPTTPIP